MFRGFSTTTLDKKGRLKIPACFRHVLRERFNSEELFLTSFDRKSIRIYPLSEWSALEKKLTAQSALNPSINRFIMRSNYFGKTASLDPQGRVMLRSDLRATASLEGEVGVLGQLQYLEVWNLTQLDELVNNAPITEDIQSELASLGI